VLEAAGTWSRSFQSEVDSAAALSGLVDKVNLKAGGIELSINLPLPVDGTYGAAAMLPITQFFAMRMKRAGFELPTPRSVWSGNRPRVWLSIYSRVWFDSSAPAATDFSRLRIFGMHNVSAARPNTRTKDRQDRNQRLAPQAVLFTSNPARNSLPRTYRLKKAAQPEEFASAQLMRVRQQQDGSAATSSNRSNRASHLWKRIRWGLWWRD
jgi:hypothetical protein